MTTNPRDLYLHIGAVRSAQHVLNGGPKNATFPGWFLQVQQNEGYDALVVSQLAGADVVRVAELLDELAPNTLARNYIKNAVTACDRAMRDEVAKQLAFAEQQAARIPQLRKLLEERE